MSNASSGALQRLRSRWFGDKQFYRMALAIAIPIMIQNGISTFVGLLDNIMVGSVGTLQMGGVGIANQLLLVFNLTIFGSVSGAGIFGAQFFGKGDHDGVRYAMRFKLLIGGFFIAVGWLVFTLLGDRLIALFLQGEGTDADRAETLVYARQYLDILMISFVPFVLASTYSGTLRECGQTVVPMVAGIISVAVNLVLNALLIYGLIGLPKLGIAGAAIATVIARTVQAAVIMIWAHTHADRCPFVRGLWRSMYIPGKLGLNILVKSIPLTVNECLWSAGMSVLSMCYSMHSMDVVPAMTISSTISNVFNVAFMAMGIAIGIIVGQLLGAGKMQEAVDTDRKLILFGVLICLVLGSIMALLSPYIPLIYTEATEPVRALAAQFILISALCMPVFSLGNACYFTMRSGGKTFITFLFDSCFVWTITVPLIYCLNTFTALPIVPIYLCGQLVEIVKGAIGIVMIKRGYWINNIVSDAKTA